MNLHELMLKAISDPKRYKILELIANTPMCGCKILKYFKISQPTLSYDLKLLRKCNLIQEKQKHKKCVVYQLKHQSVISLINLLQSLINKREK